MSGSALFLDWPNLFIKGQGGDLKASPTGSLATASGSTLAQQKLIRALLSNRRLVQVDGTVLPPDYVYVTDFGDSLCRELGDSYNDADLQNIKAIILESVASVDEIATVPAPQVSLKPAVGGLVVVIQYWDAQTNRPQSVGFTIPNS